MRRERPLVQYSTMTSFLDVETLFPRFGLPLDLAPGAPLPSTARDT